MTTVAVVVMVLAVLLLWGGLVISILVLRRDGRRAVTEDVDEVRGPSDDVPPPDAASAP